MEKGRSRGMVRASFKIALVVFFIVNLWSGTTASGPDFYEWTQSSWSSNANPTAKAYHPGNLTGWSQYYSKDTPYGIDTSSGKVKLAAIPATITSTTLTDFNSTEFQNIEKVSDGNGALKLLPSIADPFSNNELRKWRALPSVPYFNYNTAYTRMGDYIYCIFVEGDGKQFARIKISEMSDPAALPRWEFLTSLPAPLGAGAAITNDGQYIFVLRGGGSNECYFYLPPEGTNPGTNPFTSAQNPITLPVAGSTDPVLAWPKFSSLLEPIKKGSSMIHVGTITDYSAKVADGGDLYAVAGGGQISFFYYNKVNKKWNRFTNQARASVTYGATLAYSGGYNVYLVFGDNYAGRVDKFNRSTGTWSDASNNSLFPKDPNLPSTTNRPTLWEGSVCSYPGSGDYIYAAFCYYTYMQPYRSSGSHTIRGFFRFGPLSDPNPTWQRLDDTPGRVGSYSSIIYDPDIATGNEGKRLHLFSGMNFTRPWIYKTEGTENHWETLSLPFTYTSFNSMCYVNGDAYTGNKDYIYFTVRSTWFFRYDVSANKWELLSYLPETASERSGNRLAYMNGYIYYLPGGDSADASNGYKSGFYRYNVSQAVNGSDSWDAKLTLPQLPRVDLDTNDTIYNDVNVGAGIISVSQGGKNFIYAIRSSLTPYFYRIEIDSDNNPVGDWVSMPSTKDKDGRTTKFRGTNLEYPGYPEDGADNHTYIYALTYFTTTGYRSGYAIFKYGPIEHDTDADINTVAQWYEVPVVPPHGMTDYYGMSIVYPGSGQYLYTTTGQPDSSIGRYDMASGNWIKLNSVVPAAYQYYSQAVGGNNSVYLTTYYSANSFYRYDLTSGAWNEIQIDRSGQPFETGSAIKDSNNNVYFVGGRDGYEISSHIWVYDTALKQWKGIIRAPFPLGRGCVAEYLSGSAGSINSIYVAEGRESNRFCKYNITSGQWSFCSNVKAPVTTGSQITTDGISNIYFVAGGSSNVGKTVWTYSALDDDGFADPWSEFSPTIKLPFASTISSDLMEYAQGKLYLMAQSSSIFYSYTIGGGVSGWESNLAAVGDSGSGSSIVPSGGICLYYPGTGPKLYCIPRDGFSDFLSYDIGLNQWASLKEMPCIPTGGMSAIIDTGERWMYVFNGSWTDHLIRYDKTSNIWDEISAMPVALRANSALCAYKGFIYALNGGYTSDSVYYSPVFYRYNTDGDVWEELQAPELAFTGQGIAALPVENPYDGKAYIYFTGGYGYTSFLRYSISENTWQTIASPPGGPGWTWLYGNSMTQLGNHLYITDGNSTNFWKYRLDNTYDMAFSTPLPEDVGRGASVTYSGYDGYIYLFPGGRQFTFYKWKPGMFGWSPLPQCPVSVNDSQSKLLYPGFGKYLYYVQGSSYGYSDRSSVFLRYNMDPDVPVADKWNELTPSSFGINVPGTLLYTGGQNFYVPQGYNSPFFSKYSAFCFGDYTSRPIEVGRHCKWGAIDWDNAGTGSVSVSVRTGSKLVGSNLTDALDWGKATSVEKGQILSDPSRPISSVKDADKYIQYRLNFSTDDTGPAVAMPQLDEIRIGWEKYVSEKFLISSPYDTEYNPSSPKGLNRLRRITWNNAGAITNPSGTEIRFQLRTSADGNTWSGWLGPGGTRTSIYDLDNDSLYVRAGEVKQLNASDSNASLYKELENFSFWQEITITNSGTSQIEAGEVALIDIDSSKHDFWDDVQPTGRDIRFFDGTKKVAYFLAKFDSDKDVAQIAVKLNNSIASGATAHIYMFYGNAKVFSESDDTIRNFSAIKTDTSLNNTGWWDCNLKEGSTSSPYTPDSSSQGNALYLKKNVIISPGQGVSGGNALYVDGASGYLTTTWRPVYRYKGNNRTFSLWIKPELDVSGSCLLSSYPINGYNYRIIMNSSREITFYVSNSKPGIDFKSYSKKVNTPVPGDNNWHNIVWTLKGNSGVIISAADNGAGKVRYYTSSAHNLVQGEMVSVTGMGQTSYNAFQTVTAVPDSRHFDSNIDYVYNSDVYGTYSNLGTTSVYLDGTLVSGPWTHYITDWDYVDTSFPNGTEFIFGSYVSYDVTSKSYLYKGFVDNLSVYDYAFDDTLAKCMYAGANRKLVTAFSGNFTDNSGANLKTTGKFYTNNPTIEPIYGAFYNYNSGDTLASFVQDPVTNPPGTNIKYQVSPDGYNWYWWQGIWKRAEGGSLEANVYTDINTNLGTFKDIILPAGATATSGDLYWRAYLMSTDSGSSTPHLNGVTVNVTNSGSFYYTDPSGAQNINIENENCVADRWIQYKAFLYSDGENTPTLNDIGLRYVEPSIAIGMPAGGAAWVADSTENITWTSVGLEGTKPLPATHGVQIEYSINNGLDWVSPSVVNDTGNDGLFEWHIPFDPATQARVRITSRDYPVITTKSINPFRILGIMLNLPNGGEIWEKGSLHNVEFRTAGYTVASTKLKLQLSSDGGITYPSTLAQEQTDASPWQIPWRINQSPSDNVKLRIYDADPVYCTPSIRIVDESNNVFSIVQPPSITMGRVMKVPEEDEVTDGKLIAGKRYSIEWHTSSQHFADNFIVEYSKDGFATPGIPLGTVASGVSGGDFPSPTSQLQCNYLWMTVPYDIGDITLKIREDPATVPSPRDTPDPREATMPLTIIEPYFTMTRPNGGEIIVSGDKENILWTTTGSVTGPFKLEYCTDYNEADPFAATWSTIEANTSYPYMPDSIPADVREYSWPVPAVGQDQNNCRIRITDLSTNTITDMSDVSFTIIPHEKVAITGPNGGEEWVMGVPYNITWVANGQTVLATQSPVYVYLYYSADGGATYEEIPSLGPQVAWKQSCEWTPELPLSTTQAKIKIEALDIGAHPHIVDESDGIFSIKDPSIARIWMECNSAEMPLIYATGEYYIRWENYGAVSNSLNIEYRLNGGNWQPVTSATTAQEGDDKSKIWTIPPTPGTLEFRMTDNNRVTVSKVSDAFNIIMPAISITEPAEGFNWVVGLPGTVSWTTTGGETKAIKRLKVQCIANGTTNPYEIGEITAQADLDTNAGSLPFTMSANAPVSTATSKAIIKIFDPDPTGSGVQKTLEFNIKEPSLYVDTPTQAMAWRIGSQNKLISWHRLGMVTYPINIYCKTSDGFEHHLRQITDQNVSGSWTWSTVESLDTEDPEIVPGPSYIIIRDSTTPNPIYSKFDTDRNGLFTIEAPKINVLGPTNPEKLDKTPNPHYGELWTTTDTRTIEWECDGKMDGPSFKVEWLRFVNSQVVASGTIAEGLGTASRLAQWNDIPPEAVGSDVRIKVTNVGSSYNTTASSVPFIVLPIPEFLTLSLNEPVTGTPTSTVRIGNTYDIKWTRNVAAFSDEFELYYTLEANPATDDWVLITETPIHRLPEKYSWSIPYTDISPSANAKLKIYDTKSWKFAAAEHTEKIIPLNIGRPIFKNIRLTKPGNAAVVNSVALGENPVISWGWDGYISDGESVSIKLVVDDGTEHYEASIPGYHPNTGHYDTWEVPLDAPETTHARIVLQDIISNYGVGNEVIDESEEFTIINRPEIIILIPNGGQDYIIGTDSIDFQWESKGISVDQVRIELSGDDFKTSYPVIDVAHPDGKFPNTGSLTGWVIPQDCAAGSQVKARISMVGREADVFAVSQNYFRIRSGFIIKSPVLGDKWATNEEKNITWETRGGIPKVSLFYSVDGGSTFKPIPEAQNIDNTESYSWRVPNERTDLAGTKAQVMVKDAGDTEGIIQNMSPQFDIIWYRIKFYVIDKDTYGPINNLVVRSNADAANYYPGWNEPPDLSVPTPAYLASPVSNEFPYGTYVVTWSTKPVAGGTSEYFDLGVEVKADANTARNGVLVQMENRISAQIEWHVILTNAYTVDTDTLSATVWLERRGKLQEPIPIDTNEPPDGVFDALDKSNFKGCELKVYDYDTDTDTPLTGGHFTALEPDDKGLYKFVWNPTGLQPGKTYFVRATISYGPSATPYTSGATFDITVPTQQAQMIAEHAEQTTLLETIQTQAAVIQTAVTDTIPKQIESATQIIEKKVDDTKLELKQDTARILTATEQAIPAQIRDTVEPSLRSEILNRESTVRLGTRLMIRYRTYPGVSPVVNIYGPRNMLMISQAPMTEVAGSPGSYSIYEYELYLSGGWGAGDYTIVCSESTKGTMDALIISAIRTDLEDIASQVGTILGTTTSLSNLKEIADTLNSQFSIIESALGKISTDLVDKVKEVASSATDIEAVYNQLVNVGKELKTLGANQNVNLSKLLEVSKDKRQDMKYLKNKTQELKAAMEVSQKMIDNMAHKPVTQTWFEYK